MTVWNAREDGSIPMVLTVVILVGGVVAALVGTVIGTQKSVTFDRHHSEAITSADAGLQQALTHLAQRPTSDPIGTVITSASLPAAAGDTLGAGDFTWTATKDGPLRWEVRASGVVGGETRVVESTISARSEFFVAAFADQGITFRGGNGATSYPAGGSGSIGSNNAITMNGNSYADFIYLYGSSASCSGTGCSSGAVDGFDDSLDMTAIRANVQEKHDALCPTFSAWTASQHDVDGDGVAELNPGDVICASQVNFDMDVEVVGATSSNPVQMLVTGDITAGNSRDINCIGCTPTSQPISAALRIYSLGPTFGLGNHSHFAAAVLAPNASCAGSNSNAQTDMYGSIICRSMGNQGGWVFHYDEQLMGLGAGKLDITSYREESTATTSFGP